MSEVRIDVRGMTCATCANRVQTALADVPGVDDVVVNYATDVAIVNFVGTDYAPLLEAVEDAGYEAVGATLQGDEPASPRERITDRRAEEARQWMHRWVVGALLTTPIMLLQMGSMWFGLSFAGWQAARLVLLIVLTAAVVGYVGLPYVRGAWNGLKHRSANMDTLVALGSGVAFIYSTVESIRLLAGPGLEQLHDPAHHTYFDGAAMILTLISVGKFLEARAKGRAGAEIEALLDLAAKQATVRRGDGWTTIDVQDVVVGDLMLIKPGEKIPTDGVIRAGTGTIDEAMLTGESVPVTRGPDDEVVGGTINTDGRLEVEATRVGAQTALAQIAKVVEEAQQSKAAAQRLADRVSGIFVPVIIAIAAVTFVAWFLASGSLASAIAPAVAVLIVACPCALGLATPTAIMVGTGRAAQRGILIRDAAALERVRELDAIVFDKTGTLTHGQMQVTDVVPVGVSAEALLQAAASLESASEHPIARAVVAHAADAELIEPRDFLNIAGSGVRATLDDVAYRIGKPGWIDAPGAEELENHGKTVVAVERDGEFIGLIALRDELKPDAAATIAELGRRGIETWMITGDNARTAIAIAAEAGIPAERVRAGVAPADKADAIKALRADGRIVAMVGDGINDAPALASADLGIALGSGTDVAMQTADITLVGAGIDRVLAALRLSMATNRKIRQNLFWAFAYNVVLVPVAAFGLLQPIFAAAAMALSSVSVVTNSLLLARAE